MHQARLTKNFLFLTIGFVFLDAKSYALITTSTCGGSLTNSGSGRITSPLFPNKYPANLDCEWTISATFGHGIKILIEFLDNREFYSTGVKGSCYDTMDISEVMSGRRTSNKIRLCGNSVSELPSKVFYANTSTSENSTVRIRFKSDGSEQRAGFALRYFIMCDTVESGTAGTFVSPNYPQSYPHDTQCTTVIKTAPGTRILLLMDMFHLASSEECSEDYVSFKTNKTGSYLGPHEKYCSDIPSTIISPTNELFIQFNSDSSVTGRGISAHWVTASSDELTTQISTAGTLNTTSNALSSYTGNCAITTSGKTCQRWDVRRPHIPRYKPANAKHNFCRPLDNDSVPWCYTTDFRTRWEHCDVKNCFPELSTISETALYPSTTDITTPESRVQRNTEDVTTFPIRTTPDSFINVSVFLSNEMSTYNGTCSETISGFTCQRWDSSRPHIPIHTPHDPKHNFCRALSNDRTPWCYTTSAIQRWDYCDVKNCLPEENIAEELGTTVDATTEAITSKESSSEFGYNVGRSANQPSAGVNTVAIVVGVAAFLILCLAIVIIIVMRRRHKKNVTRLDRNDDVVFQNLTSAQEEEVDNGDALRQRDNTYVEIPFSTFQETPRKTKYDSPSSAPERLESNSSVDSVAAAKLEAAMEGLNQTPSVTDYELAGPASTSEETPYTMADDNEPVFDQDFQTQSEVKPYNPYQLIEDEEHVNTKDKGYIKPTSSDEPNLYDTPKSPHGSVSHSASIYDNPKPHKLSMVSGASPKLNGRRGLRNQSVDSNYCPMNNTFKKKSPSLSQENDNHSNAMEEEKVVGFAVYTSMGPQ